MSGPVQVRVVGFWNEALWIVMVAVLATLLIDRYAPWSPSGAKSITQAPVGAWRPVVNPFAVDANSYVPGLYEATLPNGIVCYDSLQSSDELSCVRP